MSDRVEAGMWVAEVLSPGIGWAGRSPEARELFCHMAEVAMAPALAALEDERRLGREMREVIRAHNEEMETLRARVAELEADAARLDWLETRPREHPAAGWVARESTTGRGYRLHTSVSREHETHDTVRAAIDAARAAQGVRDGVA